MAYLLTSCLLLTFYVVYDGYLRGVTVTDGIIVYDNISDVLYYSGFSLFFFVNGYRIKDHSCSSNTIWYIALVFVYAFISALVLTPKDNLLDFTGIRDGSWAVWFLPVLAMYLLTGIPLSNVKVDAHPFLKGCIPVAFVILFFVARILLHDLLDFGSYHLSRILFFLPLLYMGYFYRTRLEREPYFCNYVRMSTWGGCSAIIIISVLFLRYCGYPILCYGAFADVLIQIACLIMSMSLFASIRICCYNVDEQRIWDGSIFHAYVLYLVLVVLLYEKMISLDEFVEVMNTHFIVMPIATAALLFLASSSIVLLLFIVWKIVMGCWKKTLVK